MSNEQLTWAICESQFGQMTLVAGPGGIRGLYFPGRSPRLAEEAQRPMPGALEQLEAYFAGRRQAFELDLDPRGTPLQERVWELLLEIPYGTTTSYGELTGRVDEALFPDDLEPYERPRHVGAAIGRNPIPILVACHRVIGADGSLTGYRGGLQLKQALLDLESGGGSGQTSEPSWADRQIGLL